MSRYDKAGALDKVADGLACLAADLVIAERDDTFPSRAAQDVLDWIYVERHKRELPIRGCFCDGCHDARREDR